jgi:hypothetical protein
MKYIDKFEDLVKFLALFHLYEQKPRVLIIDSLDFYAGGSGTPENVTKKALLL